MKKYKHTVKKKRYQRKTQKGGNLKKDIITKIINDTKVDEIITFINSCVTNKIKDDNSITLEIKQKIKHIIKKNDLRIDLNKLSESTLEILLKYPYDVLAPEEAEINAEPPQQEEPESESDKENFMKSKISLLKAFSELDSLFEKVYNSKDVDSKMLEIKEIESSSAELKKQMEIIRKKQDVMNQLLQRHTLHSLKSVNKELEKYTKKHDYLSKNHSQDSLVRDKMKLEYNLLLLQEEVPTITIFIAAHGFDMPRNVYNPKTIVRVLTMAETYGNIASYYVKKTNEDGVVKKWFDEDNTIFRVFNIMNHIRNIKLKSSYYNLLYIQNLLTRKYHSNSSLIHPIIDHSYVFRNSHHGIFLLDISNYSSIHGQEDTIGSNLLLTDFAFDNNSHFYAEKIEDLPEREILLTEETKENTIVKLSQIVDHYYDKGFRVINIIDNSCRGCEGESSLFRTIIPRYEKTMSQQILPEYKKLGGIRK